MTGTADPWEPPTLPALSWRTQHRPHVERSTGPERVTTEDPPPDWTPPRPVGFRTPEPRPAPPGAITHTPGCLRRDRTTPSHLDTTHRHCPCPCHQEPTP